MKGNQLESGSYTSIFEIFVIGNAGGFLVDDTIIYHVYGDSHYMINTFESDKIDSVPKQKFISFPVVIKEDFVLRLHLFQI